MSGNLPRAHRLRADWLVAIPVDVGDEVVVEGMEERVLTIGVECYAGHRGEQAPRTLVLGDRRIRVVEIVDAWLAPDYRYFKVKGDDGDTYLVRHDEAADVWELTMFRAERIGRS